MYVMKFNNVFGNFSVTYDPSNLLAYAAWENHDDTVGWVPAACNTYLKIDLKEWF